MRVPRKAEVATRDHSDAHRPSPTVGVLSCLDLLLQFRGPPDTPVDAELGPVVDNGMDVAQAGHERQVALLDHLQGLVARIGRMLDGVHTRLSGDLA